MDDGSLDDGSIDDVRSEEDVLDPAGESGDDKKGKKFTLHFLCIFTVNWQTYPMAKKLVFMFKTFSAWWTLCIPQGRVRLSLLQELCFIYTLCCFDDQCSRLKLVKRGAYNWSKKN